MRRVAAKILRLALEDPRFARLLLAEFRKKPEFQAWVENKRFQNPDTRNKVLFKSLPDPEQRRIYLEWWRGRRKQDAKKTKDPKELEEKRKEMESSNPWTIPLWEYIDRVQEGAGKKWHGPGEIPTHTVEDLDWMGPPGEKHVKIGERKFGDEKVDFYRKTERVRYVKRDENDEVVRNPETGKAEYLSEQEMLDKKLPLFASGIDAYVGDTPIGFVANEWGATLVQVAEEYQRKGIGKFLSKLWRKAYPFRGSGGFSAQGLSAFKRVYQDFVQEALQSGKYDKALDEGWMEPGRFYEILNSAGLDEKGEAVEDPKIRRPPPPASDKLKALRKELAESKKREREMEDGDFTEDEKLQQWANTRRLYDETSAQERKEMEEAKQNEATRQERMEELASAYWKARKEGDTALAKRLYDQMGTV